MEAILLCGGLGTRLRSVVSDRPKPMADIAGKPFLHYLVRMLSEKGVERFVFALGYMGEQIEAYFQDGREYGISIVYSYEESPLGTGGAIRNALSKMQEEDVLILNADTYFEPLSGAEQEVCRYDDSESGDRGCFALRRYLEGHGRQDPSLE